MLNGSVPKSNRFFLGWRYISPISSVKSIPDGANWRWNIPTCSQVSRRLQHARHSLVNIVRIHPANNVQPIKKQFWNTPQQLPALDVSSPMNDNNKMTRGCEAMSVFGLEITVALWNLSFSTFSHSVSPQCSVADPGRCLLRHSSLLSGLGGRRSGVMRGQRTCYVNLGGKSLDIFEKMPLYILSHPPFFFFSFFFLQMLRAAVVLQ